MATTVTEPISFDLDADYYAAIGQVAAEWDSFELVLSGVIWILSGIPNPDLGVCVTTQIFGANAKLNALLALLEAHGGSTNILKKIDKFAQKTHSVSKKRNRIVHDPWMKGIETGEHYRLEIVFDRKLMFAHKSEDVSEIKRFAREIRKHKEMFVSIWDETKNHESLRESLLRTLHEPSDEEPRPHQLLEK